MKYRIVKLKDAEIYRIEELVKPYAFQFWKSVPKWEKVTRYQLRAADPRLYNGYVSEFDSMLKATVAIEALEKADAYNAARERNEWIEL